MKLSERDRRALILLGVALVVTAIVYVAVPGEAPAPVVAGTANIPAAEKRLARLRALAASVPGKQEVLRTVTAELESREKGIVRADTGAQAQARVLEIVRRVAKALPNPWKFGPLNWGRSARTAISTARLW
jgi:type II secretory pathway component PulM